MAEYIVNETGFPGTLTQEITGELIRCKDCKQFRRWIDTDICFCDITESERSDNDFCSRAEKWEEGEVE